MRGKRRCKTGSGPRWVDGHGRGQVRALAVADALEPRRLLSVLPIEPEFRVNTGTDWSQNDAAVAMSDDGGFVVVWEGEDDSGHDDIYFQRFSPQNVPVGPQTRVNTTTTGDQRDPVVAMDHVGSFVVAWEDEAGADGAGGGIFARRFDATGEGLSDQFLVNTTTTGSQNDAAVAMNPDGQSVIVWKSANGSGGTDIMAQHYDVTGNRAGEEFQVGLPSSREKNRDPSVALDPSGDFVITWWQGGRSIMAQRFDALGQEQGDTIFVPLGSDHSAYYPVVAMDSSGGFVIAWSQAALGLPAINYAIAAQRFNASGEAVADAFVVTQSPDQVVEPTIAMDAQGAFVVAWENRYNISARRYEPTGEPDGPTFPVSDYLPSAQNKPSVGMVPSGGFVIAWESDWADGIDNVYARLYAPMQIDAPATVGGIVWKDANADGLRDPNETGVDGVTVLLYFEDSSILAETVTSNGGQYCLGSIPTAMNISCRTRAGGSGPALGRLAPATRPAMYGACSVAPSLLTCYQSAVRSRGPRSFSHFPLAQELCHGRLCDPSGCALPTTARTRRRQSL